MAKLCDELGVTWQTFYHHVDLQGKLRADGRKLLEQMGRRQSV